MEIERKREMERRKRDGERKRERVWAVWAVSNRARAETLGGEREKRWSPQQTLM